MTRPPVPEKAGTVTLARRAGAWTDRDVLRSGLLLLRARLTLLRFELAARPTMAVLRLAHRLELPIPDRVFRLAARLTGISWPPTHLFRATRGASMGNSTRPGTRKSAPDAAPPSDATGTSGMNKTEEGTQVSEVVPTQPKVMVSPINGATCPVGGKRGNSGGKPGRSGRQPSVVRERLRGTFDERIAILAEIADGEPVVRSRVALASVLPHVTCPSCGGQLEPAESSRAIEIEAVTSASPKDRVYALDVMAKYGLGTLKEVSAETVRAKVSETIELIRQQCPPELSARIYDAMRRIWTR